MSRKNIENMDHKSFESIRQINEDGLDFWYARDLQTILDYTTWDKFKRVIDKAIIACNNAGQAAKNHFSQVAKMVQIGSGAQRE